MEHNGDLSKTLRDFGEELANEVFHDHNYMIYKNRYMYWTADLDKGWEEYMNIVAKKDEKILKILDEFYRLTDIEEMHFVKSVFNYLIRRNFQENWNKEQFLTHYYKHVKWLENGLYTK